MFSVYVHTNRQNGKRYVGITANDPATRWNHGRGYKGNRKFWADIESLGWDAFDHEIVASGLTKQEAVEKEAELIREFDTVANGYNNENGGRYATHGHLSGDARLFYDGISRLTRYRKAWDGWAFQYELLKRANRDGGRPAEVLNSFCSMASAVISKSYPKPRWGDVEYIDEFIWILRYIEVVAVSIDQGELPPPYVSYTDAMSMVIDELLTQNKKAAPVCKT